MANLLKDASLASSFEGGELAIFRLAPGASSSLVISSETLTIHPPQPTTTGQSDQPLRNLLADLSSPGTTPPSTRSSDPRSASKETTTCVLPLPPLPADHSSDRQPSGDQRTPRRLHQKPSQQFVLSSFPPRQLTRTQSLSSACLRWERRPSTWRSSRSAPCSWEVSPRRSSRGIS